MLTPLESSQTPKVSSLFWSLRRTMYGFKEFSLIFILYQLPLVVFPFIFSPVGVILWLTHLLRQHYFHCLTIRVVDECFEPSVFLVSNQVRLPKKKRFPDPLKVIYTIVFCRKLSNMLFFFIICWINSKTWKFLHKSARNTFLTEPRTDKDHCPFGAK